ncbi:MAG: hypothetical protein NXI28_26945 [bacterium]|nr:hypothetical protein [bacterium]
MADELYGATAERELIYIAVESCVCAMLMVHPMSPQSNSIETQSHFER